LDEIAIVCENISKSFKLDMSQGFKKMVRFMTTATIPTHLTALNEISLSVKKGEVLGIIGSNGSGKTTLLRIIAGIYKPDSGKVKVNGRLSPLLQLGTGFQSDLVARENIVMNGMLLGLSKSEIEDKIDTILEFAGLERFSELKLKNYSSGMRARLAFSTAMQINPDILLLDEILAVGDKEFAEKSWNAFLSFKKNNKTILHTTHNLPKAMEFSDRILLLDKGNIVMIGNPKEVIKKYTEISNPL